MPPPILVTGAAGFIGFHVAKRLSDRGFEVVGFDNLNPYYNPRLKAARIERLSTTPGWRFVEGDLADASAVDDLFASFAPRLVIHLGAQAGVRWSLTNPAAYVSSNLVGFGVILEACRRHAVDHLVYASSSSVYGADAAVPFSTHRGASHPVSLYAATKRANELMAHSYSDLFGLPTTGLRFFTVYGPWGRPDMAYWKFTEALLRGTPIEVYGGGTLARDFTYVDDVVDCIERILPCPAEPSPVWDALTPDPATSRAPYRLYNIGNHAPVTVNEMLGILERITGRRANRVDMPKPPGDVDRTFADVSDLTRDFAFSPATPLAEGLDRFVRWFGQWQESAGA